jgi:phage N-6-adenine-methyltransferase
MSLARFKGSNHPQQVGARGPDDEIDDRGTTWEFFEPLHAAHRFTLDVAAAPHNAKVDNYYTRFADGLLQPWPGRVWCNPPYSDIGAWVAKAWREWHAGRPELIVMLLPANRTEQGWWQDQVEPYRDRGGELTTEFIRGRLRFIKSGATEIKPNERPPFGVVLLRWTR